MERALSEGNIKLNQQQLDMLRLFQNPMPEQDYLEIKRVIVKALAKNIDTEMELLEKEKGWTEQTYEDWGKEHLRTPYKK
ncbi:MAG: hypothetical protein ABI594_18650 [Ginsengibacter sp.]